MRHRHAGRKLNRPTGHRNALLRNLVKDLLTHEAVRTTEPKAREARRAAEKIITLGKRGTLAARRQAISYLNDKDIAARVFDVIAPRFADRNGGYTRILKLGHRVGDNAPMARLELLPAAEE
jgi:large subunit ribosomal protein L17